MRSAGITRPIRTLGSIMTRANPIIVIGAVITVIAVTVSYRRSARITHTRSPGIAHSFRPLGPVITRTNFMDTWTVVNMISALAYRRSATMA